MAELIPRRARDAKHIDLGGGVRQAIFSPFTHYQDDQGNWQDVDLNFEPQGGGVHVVTRHLLQYRADATGLAIWHKPTGRGIKFLFPRVPDRVSGRWCEWDMPGITWRLTARKTGIKTTARVTTKRGPKTYRFDAQMLGGLAAPVANAEGDLVQPAGHFTIPRPVVLGADGVTYATSGWRIVAGEAAFDFDDGPLPNEALPYIIDPTTEFSVAASGDDGQVQLTSASYPPTGTPVVVTDATTIDPRKRFSTPNYDLYVSLIRWDTSSLPDDATIDAATLRVRVLDKNDDDSRDLTAEWYDVGTIGTEDWTSTVGTDAHAGTALVSITDDVDNDLALTNVSNVNTTGYTGLRLHISGGAPTGYNRVLISSFDSAIFTEPRLLVTYTEFELDVGVAASIGLAYDAEFMLGAAASAESVTGLGEAFDVTPAIFSTDFATDYTEFPKYVLRDE